MNRDEMLRLAAQYVTKDRQSDHGPPERNFEVIAELWNAYLGFDAGVMRVIQPHDVALMMALLKIARAKGSPMHLDNWVDIAGYAACGGELATKALPTDTYELAKSVKEPQGPTRTETTYEM